VPALSFPIFVPIGSLRIPAHLILESLAYLAGFQLFRLSRKRSGDFLADPGRMWIVAAAICGAAIGSKLLYWLEDPMATWHRWNDPAYLLAGKTIVGGLLGGTLAVEWVKKRLAITRRTGDLFAVPLALGIAIGRIGCFTGGLADNTYGIATNLPWGVDFGDGVHRHQTQLYEALFLVLLAWALHRLGRRTHREGDVFRAFMIAYLGWRVAIDFLKPGVPLLGLTSLQWASIAGIIAYRRDVLQLFARKEGAPWEAESGLTSITTSQLPSAPVAIGAPTGKSSSRTETSIS
jgi:phosphatidylglycerol:prolipoprotein diacylglycerol transferase